MQKVTLAITQHEVFMMEKCKKIESIIQKTDRFFGSREVKRRLVYYPEKFGGKVPAGWFCADQPRRQEKNPPHSKRK